MVVVAAEVAVVVAAVLLRLLWGEEECQQDRQGCKC